MEKSLNIYKKKKGFNQALNIMLHAVRLRGGDIHGPQRMKPTDFVDPLTLRAAPPAGWVLHLSSEIHWVNLLTFPSRCRTGVWRFIVFAFWLLYTSFSMHSIYCDINIG